jgi:hypothetical protein
VGGWTRFTLQIRCVSARMRTVERVNKCAVNRKSVPNSRVATEIR